MEAMKELLEVINRSLKDTAFTHKIDDLFKLYLYKFEGPI